MSEENVAKAPEAGNTVESLTPKPVEAKVETPKETPKEVVKEAPKAELVKAPSKAAEAEKVVAVVTRAEFDELKDKFNGLVDRIEKHNVGAPFRI